MKTWNAHKWKLLAAEIWYKGLCMDEMRKTTGSLTLDGRAPPGNRTQNIRDTK
jgi:hypothetical protein